MVKILYMKTIVFKASKYVVLIVSRIIKQFKMSQPTNLN